MLKNIGSTLLVMVIAMLSSFVVTIILGRNLSIGDFGEFALLKQILLIGSSIAVFGLDHSLIKQFSKYIESRKFHCIFTMFNITICIAIIFTISGIYGFYWGKLIIIYLSVVFGGTSLYLAAINRVRNQYLIAQLITSGWKIILFIMILILLFFKKTILIDDLYVLVGISLLIPSMLIIKEYFISNKNKVEKKKIKAFLTYGIIFWLINTTGLISGGIDKLLLPIIYNNEILGIFTGTSFIFIISMTMVGSAIGYVIFPKVSKGESINLKSLIYGITGLSFGALILFYFSGNLIISFLFEGKYDQYLNTKLILLFTLLGITNIIHTITHFLISACCTKQQLLLYWIISILFILILAFTLKFLKTNVQTSIMGITLIFLVIKIFKIVSMNYILKKSNRIRNWQIVQN